MTIKPIPHPRNVSREQWLADWHKVIADEKELTKQPAAVLASTSIVCQEAAEKTRRNQIDTSILMAA